MEVISLDTLQSFISSPVEVSIQDGQGEDKAPFVKQTVLKLETCPDHTHLRIFFDQKKFFAVPLTSTVTMNESEWIAFDRFSELHYVIRKVD